MYTRKTLGFAVLLALCALFASPAAAQDRTIVDASDPDGLAVTVYRDPNRGPYTQMNRNWPQGFAMISETRQVTLPPGESTIRFTGVAEGMVAVSAIVTGLPGGTIEKNRNADLLSPAALVDGSLGNRVRITRTNPGTGEAASESAIIRTRADGGLVLQTDNGFEAVRCSGLPERLTFDAVPDGLSSEPVFTLDTRDEGGGTYTVTLSYLAWGFDWQANYVATLHDSGQEGGQDRRGGNDVRMSLMSWLTILNDNNQSFENAELMAVAGTLNVVSDFQGLANPPTARPLRLTCYPLGSSLAGSPMPNFNVPRPPLPSPPMPMMAPTMMRSQMEMSADSIMVTGGMMAGEESLGDLKLYRIPENVTVSAQGLKQVAFLNRDEVEGRYVYLAQCQPWSTQDDPVPSSIMFSTVNDEDHGLGVALPSGSIAFFEPSASGELLVGEQNLRDYADGQDVELTVGQSNQVFSQCERLTKHDPSEPQWSRMRTTLTNANAAPVTMRIQMGSPAQWTVQGRRTTLKNGQRIVEVTIPANGSREVEWQARPALAE